MYLAMINATFSSSNLPELHNGIYARSHPQEYKEKETGKHTSRFTASDARRKKNPTRGRRPIHSFVPMRISRLPHLSRKTRRRHHWFFILNLLLPHIAGYAPRRALRGDTTTLNLQLARLALFLWRQCSA